MRIDQADSMALEMVLDKHAVQESGFPEPGPAEQNGVICLILESQMDQDRTPSEEISRVVRYVLSQDDIVGPGSRRSWHVVSSRR